jgi:hypothetical protein
MNRIKVSILGVIIVILSVAIFSLNSALPIGTGYTAKYLCSHVFLANRNPEKLYEREIKPTHILFSLVNYDIDYSKKIVTTRAFGFYYFF